MWRYWRELPPKGKIGIFFGHWYTDPILDPFIAKTKQSELIESIEQIVRFEKMLTDEGALLLKFLVSPVEGETEEAPQGAGKKTGDALAGDQNRLAAFQALRQVARGSRAGAAPKPARRPRRGSWSRARTPVTAI